MKGCATEIAKALVTTLQTGAQMAQSQNPKMSGIEALGEAFKLLTPLLNQQTELTKTMMEREISHLKETVAANNPKIWAEQMKEMQALGFAHGPVDKDVTLRQMELSNAEREREFQWAKSKWETETKLQGEREKNESATAVVYWYRETNQRGSRKPCYPGSWKSRRWEAQAS